MDTRKARLKQSIVEELEEARRRTRHLLTSVSEEDLATQHDPTMSPLIWDYGHIGYYEAVAVAEPIGPRPHERGDQRDLRRLAVLPQRAPGPRPPR
jgi:gamma-glutamyl hercynylcysteine S-oxide synthase